MLQRDMRMVKLLLEHGASDDLPFPLDMALPRPGTLFATKVRVRCCIVVQWANCVADPAACA